MNIKKQLLTDLAFGAIAGMAVGGCLAPTVLEKLNEDVTSKPQKILNTVGYYAGCALLGWSVGELWSINANQVIFTETAKEILKGCEEAAKAVI